MSSRLSSFFPYHVDRRLREIDPASEAAGGSDHKRLSKCEASDCPRGCAADAVPASRGHPLLPAAVVPVLGAADGAGDSSRLCRVPQAGHEAAAAGVQSARRSFHLPNFSLGGRFLYFQCLSGETGMSFNSSKISSAAAENKV